MMEPAFDLDPILDETVDDVSNAIFRATTEKGASMRAATKWAQDRILKCNQAECTHESLLILLILLAGRYISPIGCSENCLCDSAHQLQQPYPGIVEQQVGMRSVPAKRQSILLPLVCMISSKKRHVDRQQPKDSSCSCVACGWH